MKITTQAIRMLEAMIARHKTALEKLRAKGATAAKMRYAERAIKNYEEQLERMKKQGEDMERGGG